MNTIATTELLKPETFWGRVDGNDVWLFCLENKKGSKLFVSNYGATVQALCLRDKGAGYVDVLLGYDNLAAYRTDDFYMGAVVGRYANRIGGGAVSIEGKTYQLSTRPGGYHLHGGKQGFNKKCFMVNSASSDAQRIVLSYESADGEEGFPGELTIEVTYTLDDSDAWTVEYRATTNKTTIINLTQHAYFNLSGKPAQGIGKHQLKIYADRFLPVDRFQLPTGEMKTVRDTPFDFRTYRNMNADANNDEQRRISGGYDHSFILEEEHTSRLKKAASVVDATSGRRMEVYTTEPAVHFYAANFLKDVFGKNGIVYKPQSGFCLETGHFPDAPNHPHFPSTILKAGDVFYSKTVFQFFTDAQSL